MFLPALTTQTIGDWASGDCADLVFLARDGLHARPSCSEGSHQKRDALKALVDSAATQADLARRFNMNQITVSRMKA